MRVLIVEDERLNAERLAHLLEKAHHPVEILTICTSVKSALNWFQNNTAPDLLLLDIQLNDGTGFDVLEQIGNSVPVIFTTAYDQHTLKAFKFNSVDYLLKPIQEEELKVAITKFLSQSHKPSEKINVADLKSMFSHDYKSRFLVKIGEQFQAIETFDISYFMSEENCTYLVTKDVKTLPIDYSLEQLNGILNPNVFFRISRKYIVSITAVKQIHSYFNTRLILKLDPEPKEDVLVSRKRVNDFKKWVDS